jgi:anti-sigma regulatory factor (Ser/Thr protein kinase)
MLLAPNGAAVAQARHHAVDACREFLDDDRCNDLAVVVSELVTNAVRYGGPPITLEVSPGDGTARVEVSDGTATAPTPRGRDLFATGGRGLELVMHLTRAWGWSPLEGGKVVWCEV